MSARSLDTSQRHSSGLLLLVLSTASFMTTLDVFIVNVGLRPIGSSLHEDSLANLSWVLNAYAIVFAALLVPAGRLADRFGTKGFFLSGLAIFGVGSLAAALSGDFWLLVVFRCIQAVGAASILPTSLGLILTGFPKERLDRAIQIWAISGSLGAAAGPTLGGLLVQASWRWIFVVNAPICLLAVVAAAVVAPDPRHHADTRIPDLLGGALLMVGIGALTAALVEGSTWGWSSESTVAVFVVAIVALALTMYRSSRSDAPVVDLELFRDRTFSWANAAAFLMSLAFGLQLLGLVLWMQEGWGWSAIKTGLAISPGPLMVSMTSLGLRRYTRRLPAGLVAGAGGVCLAGGAMLIGTFLSASHNYGADILPGWLLIGAGVGLSTPTLVGAATSMLARHQTSTGSAVVQMNRQIGLTLGVAMLVVVGSSQVDLTTMHRFLHAWWWSAGFALAGTLACLPLLRGRPVAHPQLDNSRAAPSAAPAPD